MEKQKLYIPEEDSYFQNPYIDEEGWRDQPVRHYFVHGGFRGTEKNGQEARFCFYFPEKDKYEGRFYQYLSPAPEDERASESLTGEDDKISFVLSHGAYYVVTNQGGFIPGDGERLYRTSANGAQFSRGVAQRVYGYQHRPYGYVFGGSGGSFKTMSCMEMTEGVWDGAVPYVIANPMATPNVFCARVRAMRLLGEKGLKRIVDNMEPGGSGQLCDGLNEEQKEAVEEASRMGFPKRGWFSWPYMGDGSLMVLAPTIYQVYPQYFTDFWEKEGYEGADSHSSEARARIQLKSEVKALIQPEKKEVNETYTSVDNNWLNTMIGNSATPQILLKEAVPEDAYLVHCRIRVLSGAAKGKECAVDKIEDGLVTVSSAFDGSNGVNALEGLEVGDLVMLDNSDYLAMQTLQRHQVPPELSYKVYDQYRNNEGEPRYPQLPFLIAPMIARSGGGSVPCGDIHGKVIAVCSLLDESALPWHGDWYRNAVKAAKNGDEKDWFRLYYNDHCIHDDRAGHLDDRQHQVDYLGILHQALLDVAAWVEKGIQPAASTEYTFRDGQIEIPESAAERKGLQPVVDAYANGSKCVKVKVNETVRFDAVIEVPAGTGKVTAAAWDYENTNDFSGLEALKTERNGERATVSASHAFKNPGTYFPVIKVQSSRTGSLEDIFVQCKNLDRVRVIVEE